MKKSILLFAKQKKKFYFSNKDYSLDNDVCWL